MTKVTNDLIYEVLKDIQQRTGRVETSVKELQVGQSRIRNDIHSVQGEIHNLQGDVLRHDERLTKINDRLERIDRRLSLKDA